MSNTLAPVHGELAMFLVWLFLLCGWCWEKDLFWSRNNFKSWIK